MTFFLVIGLVLRIFPFFSHIFRMFTVLNVVYMTISSQEKHNFFTLFMLSRTSDNTTPQNIGGDQCMGGPPTSNFGGDRPPQSPLGLRPCLQVWQTYSIRGCIFRQYTNIFGQTGIVRRLSNK